jgi:hypothetical protein
VARLDSIIPGGGAGGELLLRWERAELNQAEAAEILGVSERTFRRWLFRYEEDAEGVWTPVRIRAYLPQRGLASHFGRMSALCADVMPSL